MREKIFVRFPDTPDDGLQWVILSQDGEIQSCVSNGTYDQLAELTAQRRVIGFAPGQYVTLTHAQLPAVNRSKMLTAVPYAVEEQLISDVDDLHFAVGEHKGEEDVPVCVIDKDIISIWHNELHDVDIVIDELIPDTLAIPRAEGNWSIAVTDHTALIRTGDYQGFASDVDSLAVTLKLAYNNAAHKPEQIEVLNYTDHELDLPEIEGVEYIDSDDESNYFIQMLAVHYSDIKQINMLQGDFSRRSQALKMVVPWFPAAAIFLAWVSISMINMGVEYYDLQSQSYALNQQQNQIFKDAFPDKKVPEGRTYRQMKKHWEKLKENNGGSDTNDPVFLALIDDVGTTLKNTPGLDLADLSFRSGVLNLKISLNNLQDLENLRTKLENAGTTKIEVVNVQAEGNRVIGRLRVQRAEA